MRVLHILDTCNRGGAETLVLDICRNSASSDTEVLLATFQGGVLFPDFQQSGVKIYKFDRKLPIDPRSLWKLRNLLVEQKIDVIHSHLTLDMVYAQLAKIGTGAKHVHTYHGYKFGSSAKDRLAEWLFYKNVDSHIYVSQPLKDYYDNERGALQNSVVIENGVDIKKYDNHILSGAGLREEIGIDYSTPLIAMVGNFVNNGRDQMTVCKALNIVKECGHNFVFLFIGRRNPDLPKIFDDCVNYCNNSGLNKHVKFLGGRPDVPNILPQLDLFVYASNHDTFGLAVVEAMLSGLPVIVNDLEPFQIIGDHGKYFTMYRTKDEAQLAEKICLFLSDQSAFKEASREAKTHAKDKYSIDRVVNQLSYLYRSLPR